MSQQLPDRSLFPKHIGVIMDGNGRWANERNLSRTQGHKVGAKVFEDITRYCAKIGIDYITFYAFSTENWKRPLKEVNFLMSLFDNELTRAFKLKAQNEKDGICMNFIGDIESLPKTLQILINKTRTEKKETTKTVSTIAINYGSQQEILNATKKICEEYKNEKISLDKLDVSNFNNYLYTNEMPPVDLMIRTGGEKRLSNYLLWQSAYSELYFTDVYWPDFDTDELDKAIIEFSNRNRRFGDVKEDKFES
ncbi:MAG: polyprenyl diphosphate synthase [Clostridia bacterium]|nr:polyprenyl diphosphate synthase [Clostridia bacterium]